jgi:cell division inhibitor SulA
VGAVSELCFNQTGIGELQLLAPALAALSRQRRWIAWLNPPFLPYPPALSALGIQVGRMLLVHPATHGDTRPDRPPRGNRQGQTENKPGQTEHRRTLWALEQAGGSGACSAVLAWLNERLLTVRDIQRLQVAARRGNTLIWLFRPEAALNQPSLASLRLRLHAAQSPGADLQRLRIDIVKRLGGWPVDGLVLDLRNSPESVDRRRVMELLTFWRSEHQQPALPDAARPYATSTSVQQRAMH